MTLRPLSALLLVLAACLAAGCGSDEEGQPIPSGIAGELQAQLGSIQERFEFPEGAACGDITGGSDPNTTQVRNLIDSLPGDVDPDVRDALQRSFDRLFELVEQECAEQPTETETETDTTETETTPTDTAPTETEPTETETTPTDTAPTETEPEPLPPGQGGEPPGQGGENPGQGNGGGLGPDEDNDDG